MCARPMPRLDRAAPLRVAHDVERGAILYRSAGIEKFRLAEDFAAGLAAHAVETDERRVADGVGEVLADVHRHASAGLQNCRNFATGRCNSRLRGLPRGGSGDGPSLNLAGFGRPAQWCRGALPVRFSTARSSINANARDISNDLSKNRSAPRRRLRFSYSGLA